MKSSQSDECTDQPSAVSGPPLVRPDTALGIFYRREKKLYNGAETLDIYTMTKVLRKLKETVGAAV